MEGSKPNFSDVKAGAWYTGWINASESLGIFQGDGNGKFRPNDTISNQEVITVLMRMLGYNDNLPGSWPVNYVTKANNIDITEDVNIVASAAAKRGDVVVMLDATLDSNLVTYDKDTDEFVKKQTTKGGNQNEDITLLADAFDGAYDNVAQFDAVNEVREAADGTLNWIAGNKTFIIDANTTVSANGESLFDLKGHQGKVYYTEDGGKYYAKYIEVDSYRVLVSDLPRYDSATDKVIVNKTKYSTAPDVKDANGNKLYEGVTFYNNNGTDGAMQAGVTDNSDLNTLGKNSKYVLYLNDDDQVYYVTSDKEDTDKAFFVKSVGSSTIKLIGDDTETIDADEDSLVWTEDGFITTEELEVGDAIVMIDDDLFVKTEAATGVLKSKTSTKWNIDGSEYVSGNAAILDDEYEDGAADIEDIYGNTVTYLLNDDNSVAAIIVDEVTIGTKLYGIVVDGDDSTGKWSQGSLTNMSIFTAEGNTIEYDLDDDYDDEQNPAELMGRLVEYKLNKDGEIKDLKVIKNNLSENYFVDVKNNAYLVGETNLTLANNVAIFEVDVDEGEVDVNLVTRAALLAEDDITPGLVEDIVYGVNAETKEDLTVDRQYFSYVTNTNGAAKAVAYTNAGSTTKYYGVIDAFDYANSDVDHGVTLVGDETEYEFNEATDGKAIVNGATDDDLIIYTKSGDKITVVKAYADKIAVAGAKEVKGYVDGLITLVDGAKIAPVAELDEAGKGAYSNIMTDSETVVYVTNSKTGKFEEGTLDDISKGDIVYVPAIDEDEYADLVIVDEYAAATSVLTKMTVVVGGNAATITDGKMALTVNQEVNLNANDADGNGIGYSKGLRFATSDASVVDFKEDADGKKDLYGNIVAKKAGTATITVTYLDATVEIEVTVTAAQ